MPIAYSVFIIISGARCWLFVVVVCVLFIFFRNDDDVAENLVATAGFTTPCYHIPCTQYAADIPYVLYHANYFFVLQEASWG